MSIKYHEWSEEQLTYPEFYKTGDQKWLGRQLNRLTFEMRKVACKEYREIYLRQGRNIANQWMFDYCNEHGRQHDAPAHSRASTKANPLQSKIDQIRKQPNRQRKSILDTDWSK